MKYEAQGSLNSAQEQLNAERGGMSSQDLQGYVGSILDDSKVYIDDTISPSRATALQYFLGERFGNEEEGRSSIVRSEEHTSELQSPCNLVCRLLLEKKKTKNILYLIVYQLSSYKQ